MFWFFIDSTRKFVCYSHHPEIIVAQPCVDSKVVASSVTKCHVIHFYTGFHKCMC